MMVNKRGGKLPDIYVFSMSAHGTNQGAEGKVIVDTAFLVSLVLALYKV